MVIEHSASARRRALVRCTVLDYSQSKASVPAESANGTPIRRLQICVRNDARQRRTRCVVWCCTTGVHNHHRTGKRRATAPSSAALCYMQQVQILIPEWLANPQCQTPNSSIMIAWPGRAVRYVVIIYLPQKLLYSAKHRIMDQSCLAPLSSPRLSMMPCVLSHTPPHALVVVIRCQQLSSDKDKCTCNITTKNPVDIDFRYQHYCIAPPPNPPPRQPHTHRF